MVIRKSSRTNVDIAHKIKIAINSGIFSIGYNTTTKSIKEGTCNLILVSNNCPSTRRLELEYLAMLNKIPIHHFFGDNIDLGIVCGKLFSCCCVGIIEPGDSDILSFLKK